MHNNENKPMRSPEEGPTRRVGPTSRGGSDHIASGQWRGRPRGPRRGQGVVPASEQVSAPEARSPLEGIGSGSTQRRSPPPAESALPASQPATTKAGLPRQRIKWSIDMNTHIMRCYHTITDLERNIPTGYRKLLHRKFIEAYPELSHLTEQNILSQLRAIKKNKLIPEAIMLKLMREIDNEENVCPTMKENCPSAQDESNEMVTPLCTNEENQGESDLSFEARIEFAQALVEYEGSDPLKRDPIRRINTSKKLALIVNAVNSILAAKLEEKDHYSLEELHLYVYCAAKAVVRLCGFERHNRSQYKGIKLEVPKWQVRLKNKVELLRADLGRLTKFLDGGIGKRGKNKVVNIMRRNGIFNIDENRDAVVNVRDTIRQRLYVTSKRLARYITNFNRRRDNYSFGANEKQFYRRLKTKHGDMINSNLNDRKFKDYWSGIWSTDVAHDSHAEWVKLLNSNTPSMEHVEFTLEELTCVLSKAENWKSSGPDFIQYYWYKKFTCLHKYLLEALNRLIKGDADLPRFLTRGITYLIFKGGNPENPADYRPITCLSTLYKTLTALLANRIMEHVIGNNLLASEQKGCVRRSLSCKEQLVIDSVVTGQAKDKFRNLWVCYIDYKKAYDSVPHTWLIQSLTQHGVSPEIIRLLSQLMQQWETSLSHPAFTQNSIPIQIKRGIFQGDTLSPLWFCLALNPLSALLKSTGYGFRIKSGGRVLDRVNHLLLMDDLKLYAEKRDHLQHLLDITKRYSDSIRMEFGLGKCKAVCVEKGIVVHSDDTLRLDDFQTIDLLDKDNTYKYLGMLQTGVIKHKDMKIKLSTEYENRVKSILKTELNFTNKIKAINTYAAPVLIYSFGILKWSNTDLENLLLRTRNLLRDFRMLDKNSCVERVTLPKNEGGFGLVDLKYLCAQQCHDMRQYFYSRESESRIKAIINTDIHLTPLDLHNRDMEIVTSLDNTKKKMDSWSSKKLHGKHYYSLNQSYVDKESSNSWLSYGGLHAETVSAMVAIQDRVTRTLNYRKHILQDSSIVDDSCRRCRQAIESIDHIIGGCSLMAPTDYKERHDHVAKIIHMELAFKNGLLEKDKAVPYFLYIPPPVIENEEIILYWDKSVLTDRMVRHNRPDIILVEKKNKKALIIDIAVPNDSNLRSTIEGKKEKYSELCFELAGLWGIQNLSVVPIVLSNTGVIPKNLFQGLTTLGLSEDLYKSMQKSVILSTVRTVRKFLLK